MGPLDDLRTFLEDFRRDQSLDHNDAIVADSFDRDLFEMVRTNAPALDEAIYDLNDHHANTYDLLRDAYLSLWQSTPTLRTRREMADTHLANHAAMAALVDSESFTSTRAYTQHDDYGACIALLMLIEQIRRVLEAHEAAIEAAAALRQQAQQIVEQLVASASTAVDGMPQSDDATAEQQEAAAAMLAAIGDALDALDQAQIDLDRASDAAEREAGNALDAGLDEAREDRADEARLFGTWGVDPGEVKRMSFDERLELARLLRGAKLSKYIELVGRFKMMANAQRARKIVEGRDDIIDVDLSNDLERVLFSEYSLAQAHPLLELDFFRRFAEGQLLSREYEGEERAGMGPIVMCVDTSSSMNKQHHDVPREAWAKAFCLAAIDEAMRLDREFHGILFSSKGQIRELHITRDTRDVRALVTFIEFMFNGGTDYVTPLDRAVAAISDAFARTNRERADIIFVTDGECGVGDQWLKRHLMAKDQMEFRTFGVLVGNDREANRPAGLASVTDSITRVTDLADPSVVRDIFRSLGR